MTVGCLTTGATSAPMKDVLEFLPCRTPQAWVRQALDALDLILLDHASLELKAAQQAQRLIRKYGSGARDGRAGPDAAFRSRLLNKMSRLAREELRHFEQVVALIERRGGRYASVSPSRYAAGLHAMARKDGLPGLTDALIVGAVIEARSCERFASLVDPLMRRDENELARFYAALLRAEARHFEDYVSLARATAGCDIGPRIESFLARDAELIESEDPELRFLSGVQPRAGRAEPAGAGQPSVG